VYGGTSTYNGLNVTTSGGAGLHTLTIGGSPVLTVNDSTFTNNAPAAVVWAIYGGSTTTLNNVNITATGLAGTGSYGIRIYGWEFEAATPSSVTINGVNVTVKTNDYGAVVQGGDATLNLQDSTLHSTGRSALYITEDNTTANFVNTTAISDARAAATIAYSGTLHATGSTFNGATDAVLVTGGGTPSDPTSGPSDLVTITGGTLTAQGGDAIHAVNTVADIILAGSMSISASSGNLLNVESNNPTVDAYPNPTASIVNFTGNGLTATGNIIADATSTLNVNLTNNTVITGAQNGVNIATTIDGTSTWNVNANSAIASLNNAGLVAFVAPTGDPTQAASYKTLTVNNYVGNGGTILFNTYLAGDGSPSDLLMINGGTATGTTTIKINNTGGLGALITGNGIPLVTVENNGTTATGAFSLFGGSVSAGAYTYTLNQGGLAGADPYDWFLRDTLTPVIPVVVSPMSTLTPTPTSLIGVAFDVRDPLDSTLQFISAVQANPARLSFLNRTNPCPTTARRCPFTWPLRPSRKRWAAACSARTTTAGARTTACSRIPPPTARRLATWPGGCACSVKSGITDSAKARAISRAKAPPTTSVSPVCSLASTPCVWPPTTASPMRQGCTWATCTATRT